MKDLFKDYLFTKAYLVGEDKGSDHAAESMFSLARLFGIRLVSGRQHACLDMISVAQRCLGMDVPEPFYRGFPFSIHSLFPAELLIDQLVEYARTYGLGDFSNASHSIFEKEYKRRCFVENCEMRDFKAVSEAEAMALLREYMLALLDSTRPLSDSQYELLREYLEEIDLRPDRCGCKDTAVRLLLDTRNAEYANLLALSDVIRLVEQLQYQEYGSTDIKRLNLKNRDRRLISKVLDRIFRAGKCDIRSCYEKKKLWNGLLHHIHYKPANLLAEDFLQGMRGKRTPPDYSGGECRMGGNGVNVSGYSLFEHYMDAGDILSAMEMLRRYKGSTAVLRNLNYILSRCKNEEDVSCVLEQLSSDNKIVLLQLLMRYSLSPADDQRIFKFTRFNKLCVHRETDAEIARRRSRVPACYVPRILEKLKANLAAACRGKLGKVYIDEAMQRIALPLQENTSMGGVGVLPRGSRIFIEGGKKLRAFTYWEQAHDIDLSAFAINADGSQWEFSWRNMCGQQSEAITFSGDVTRGYNGGSEYFDIDLEKFRLLYPDARYIVFCNNVYSKELFSKCLCKAGFMLRDLEDSGQVFEPKTVASSFRITCESTRAYLFGVDLACDEIVWLNIARKGMERVAGEEELTFLQDYLRITEVMNVAEFAYLLASELVEDPAEAGVVFADGELPLREGARQIRSCDFEAMLSLMNN